MAYDSGSPALEVEGVQKVYGGEVALSGVSLTVRPGEIHGLLGANGAGKSTLIRIISGAEPQDAGTVSIGGTRLPVPHTGRHVRELGCSLIHQDRALAPDLSIADNIALTIGFPRRRGLIDDREVARRARAALERVGLRLDVRTQVGSLAVAEQTLVAIARALAVEARVILLDEPTANLGQVDAERLYARLRDLAADGVACVLITHALGEALQICDRVTVLRNGAVVGAAASEDLTPDAVAGYVVGGDPTAQVAGGRRPSAAPANGERVSKVRLGLRELRHSRFGPISLDLRAGEIVGITGLADSGHLVVSDVLAGLEQPTAGAMEIDAVPYQPRGVRGARERAVAYVPSDRLRDGVAADMTARENLFLDGGSDRWVSVERERRRAGRIMLDAKVRPPYPDAVLSTLSGGNVQKVLLAKWLATDPRLLVLAEPTVGVDIGARHDIYERLRAACDDGLGIVLASSDFEEIVELSDRVIVLRYGTVVAEMDTSQTTVEQLAALSS